MTTVNQPYTYKGWTYTPWDDVEEDNIKKWHDFKHKDGGTVTCDFSPYRTMTEEDIRLWIDLGMPDRISSCPLNSDDLKTLWKEEKGIL